MISNTQWQIYRKVSARADQCDTLAASLHPCTDDWWKAIGEGNALRKLAIDLLEDDFLSEEIIPVVIGELAHV